MKLSLPRDLRGLSRLFWALTVVTLPVTSFKYFPFLGRDTMVRPLSFYPLAVLLVVLAIRYIRKDLRVRINGSLFLFVLFLAAAFASTALGLLQNPIPMHGQEFVGRALRAWITLAGGLTFFIGTMLMNQNEDDLRFTLIWLYAGLAVSVVWGGIQMFSYYTGIPGRTTLNKFQLLFSVRKLLAKPRAAGFAYEPSWLASQLATVYLPWLFGGLLTGFRVFKRRWIEPVLLLGATALLLMTYSRGGILMAAGSCGLVFLLTQGALLRRAWNWMVHPRLICQTNIQKVAQISLRVAILAVFMAGVVGVGWTLSRNKYFAKLWNSTKTESLEEYMVDISAGPRLAYLQAGMGIFDDYALTGVGLGASGLYLYDYIPEWSRTTVSEITRQLVYNAWLYPNPKNLLVRLLAETGIIGFGLYLIFYLNNLGQAVELFRSEDQTRKFVGLAGLTTMFVLIFFYFTQDSFIDPDGWLNLGIFLALAAGWPGPVKKMTAAAESAPVP